MPPGQQAVDRPDAAASAGGNPLWGDGWEAVRAQWTLDPRVTFLNHGSFGATPTPVLDHQASLRAEMERQPVDFLWRRLPGLLDDARERAAAYLGADPAGFVWMRNATTGIATVLAALDLEPGDEVLITDHVYPAVLNAVRHRCERAGAEMVVADVSVPLPPPDGVVDAVAGRCSGRTRLVIVEQITSPTGAIFPVESIVARCRALGAMVLVDGAHAPSHIPVDLGALDADFWTGNFHKWTCAPKGAAALVLRDEHRARVHPLVVSHGIGGGLHREFDWVGTEDPTAYLSVAAAHDFLDDLGEERLRRHNHALAAFGQRVVAEALGTAVPVPPSRFGAMALVALPDGVGTTGEEADRLQAELYAATRIEVPVTSWNGRGFVRLSAQAYNSPLDYERLAEALPDLCRETGGGRP